MARQKLITKDIERKLERTPMASTDSTPLTEKQVICKFFNPYGAGTWIVFEAERQENGWLFFGAAEIHPGCAELGYFSEAELRSIRGPANLGIERDQYPPKHVDIQSGRLVEVR